MPHCIAPPEPIRNRTAAVAIVRLPRAVQLEHRGHFADRAALGTAAAAAAEAAPAFKHEATLV